MKLKFFFCQFPNPWALRVSGMGGYTSKCEKKSKSLHPNVHCRRCAGIVQEHYGNSAYMNNAGTAGTLKEQCMNSTGILKEQCRKSAGSLKEQCRNSAGALKEQCKNNAGH